MIFHGKTHSRTRPKDVEITELKVYVAENIQEEELTDETTDMTDETAQNETNSEPMIGYVFDYYEYTKDEYINLIQEQLTSTQLALCELYEELV